MKKLICILLAFSLVLCLAACGEKEPGTTQQSGESTTAHPGYAWPDNSLFGDVPGPKDYVDRYKKSKNDQGYVYEFAVEDISYEEFRAYIFELEEAGFNIYDPSGLGLAKTEDRLPKSLDEDVFNASWSGNRRGLYVAAFWFGDEYYEKHDLAQDVNLRLTFYTYNAFDAVK